MRPSRLGWALGLGGLCVAAASGCGDDPASSSHGVDVVGGAGGVAAGAAGTMAAAMDGGEAGEAGAPGGGGAPTAGKGAGGSGKGGTRNSGGSSGERPGTTGGAGGAQGGTAGSAGSAVAGEGGQSVGGEGGQAAASGAATAGGTAGVATGGSAGSAAGSSAGGTTGGSAGSSAGSSAGGTTGGSSATGGGAGTAGSPGSAGTAGTSGVTCSQPIDEACYAGPSGTRGVGICQDGHRYCAGWSCLGEVHPAPEACNGEDDDCDGAPDDGFAPFDCGLGVCARSLTACAGGNVASCVVAPDTDEDDCNGLDDDCDGTVDEDCPVCIKVAPNGNDATALASNGATSFASVQAAIDFADTHRNVSTHVCIAAGNACRANLVGIFPGPSGAPLTMRNGIDVAGNYESTTWKRCLDSHTTTILTPTTGEGVLFPASIDQRTALHGLIVERAPGATSSGVTIDGALGAVLSDLWVAGNQTSDYSYGVNVANGADAVIVTSSMSASTGNVESIGVRVVGARVWLDRSGAFGIGPGRSIGVLLDDAPTSRVSFSTARSSGTSRNFSSYGVLVTGDGSGIVVDHSDIDATGDTTNPDETRAGIRLDACQGASPWIVANTHIGTSSTNNDAGGSVGVLARGDCHPSIDSNTQIRAWSGYYQSIVTGVTCTSDGVTSSRCTISENAEISADVRNGVGNVNLAGVLCSSGCARVSRNVAYARPPAPQTVCEFACSRRGTGISGGQYVDHNTVRAACTPSSVGIAGGGRVFANTVRGYDEATCPIFSPGSIPSRPPVGTETGISGGQYVDANIVNVVTSQWSAAGYGVVLGGGAILGNRITMERSAFAYAWEGSANADPVRFQNNRFEGDQLYPPLYRDFDTQTSIDDIDVVNSLPDVVSSGNLDLRQ